MTELFAASAPNAASPNFKVGYCSFGLLYHPELANLTPNDADLDRWLDHLKAHEIGFMRQWVCPLPEAWGKGVQPVVKVNGKYDFTKLNPAFWSFFHQVATKAAARNIAILVTLYDHYSMKVAADFQTNPINTKNGGFVPPNDKGVAFPQFYSDPTILQKTEDYTRLVLAELAKYTNIAIEPCNEPGGGQPADVTAWHRKVYSWCAQLAPALWIIPNLVYGGAAGAPTIFPDPKDAAVKAVSLHAGPNTWLPEVVGDTVDVAKVVRDKVAAEVARIGKPVIISDDSAAKGPTSRDDNRRLWLYALGAGQGGASAFEHRDFDPYWVSDDVKAQAANGDMVDEQALDALHQVKKQLRGEFPPMLPIWTFYPHPVAQVFDYTADASGIGHLVTLENGQVCYSRFTGSAWEAPKVVNCPGIMPTGKFNPPKIAAVGNKVYIVYGGGVAANNGLYFVSKTGTGAWSAPHHFASSSGRAIEYFDAVSYAGSLVIATSEDGLSTGVAYGQYLYVVGADGVPHERLLGYHNGVEPYAVKAPSVANKLVIGYRFRRLFTYTIAGAPLGGAISFDEEADIGGASAGDPAVTLADGHVQFGHVPFVNIQTDFWHAYSMYPGSVQFKIDGKPTITADTFTPYVHTTAKTTIVRDWIDNTIVLTDRDGVAWTHRYTNAGELAAAREIMPGWKPLGIAYKLPDGRGAIDIVVTGGRSGLLAVRQPA